MAGTDTLARLLDATVERAPDAVAVLERADGASRATTYAQLRDQVGRAAATLAEHGVGAGDVVGVWLPNWTEWLVLELALARLGAANLAINTRYGTHELTHLLQRGRPVGLIVPGAFHDLDFAGRLQAARAELASDAAPWVAVVRDVPPGGGPSLDVGGGQWTWELAARAAPATGAGTDTVNYFSTSGSTGFPKLAGHDQAAVARHARNVARAFDVTAGDVVLGVLPLSGVFGFNPAMAALSAGATILLEPVFDAASVLADMDELGVSHVAGGDDLLGRLMDAWHVAPRPLPALRRGGIADFSGRAATIIDWAERELGWQISGLYGSSELFALTAIWAPDQPVADRCAGGGTPVADELEVRVVDLVDERPCAVGEVGQLQFRGYNVLTEYLGDAAAKDAAFTADGWFRSGDLGQMTGRGRDFVYTCRAGDALRLRGFLVEPAEIEQFLLSHPAVEGARVVGVRDADTNADRAVAYVTLRHEASADAEELLSFCRDRLAAFKVPAALEVIEAFPTTTGTNGTKIRAAVLREWAARDLARALDARTPR